MSEDCNRTKAQQLFDEAWKLKLSPGLKLVLMSMCQAVDEDGVFRKGLHYLVLDTEYCAAQIGRIIKSLIAEKLVNIVEPKSGRRAATYSFSLSGYAYKLSIQDGYTKDLSTQNVELTESDENSLSIQNVDTTHSHDNLYSQNGHINGATGNARESAFSSTGNVDGELLIGVWEASHPANNKPRWTYTKPNLALANKLAADGFTPDEVRVLTEKKTREKDKYEFKWLDEDLRKQRRVREATPPTKPKIFRSGDEDDLGKPLPEAERMELRRTIRPKLIQGKKPNVA